MPAAGLPTTGILAVVVGAFYHISRPVFAFSLVKIVFLIVKLVTRGSQVRVSQEQVNIVAGVPATAGGPFPSHI